MDSADFYKLNFVTCSDVHIAPDDFDHCSSESQRSTVLQVVDVVLSF